MKSGSEIWTIRRDAASSYVHPTQKPVELAQRAMVNSSNRGEIVLDLFGGTAKREKDGAAFDDAEEYPYVGIE